MTNKPQWIDICALEEIPRQGARRVNTPGGALAVFRTVDDRLFALDDQCPHRNGPLSQGMVHGATITCAMHGLSIDLATGEAVAPDTGCVRRHPLRLEDGRVLLGITEVLAASA